VVRVGGARGGGSRPTDGWVDLTEDVRAPSRGVPAIPERKRQTERRGGGQNGGASERKKESGLGSQGVVEIVSTESEGDGV